MGRRRCSAFMMSVSLLTLLWQDASIARAVPIEGRTQLELQTTLVAVARAKLDGDDTSRYEEKSSNVGLFGRSGVAYGYGLRERVMLRLFFGLSRSSLKADRERPGERHETRGTALNYELAPAIRYVHPHEQLRLFVGAGLGLHGNISDYARQRGFKLGGALGFHGFLNRYVSIDPAMELSWSRVKMREEPAFEEGPTVESKGERLFCS